MTVSPYNAADHYPTITQWWRAHDTAPIPREVLPKLGVVVYQEERPILSAWASMDNSTGLAFYLWPTGNPAASPRQIKAALQHSVAYLSEVVRSLGYHTFIAGTHRRSVARQLSILGFATDPRPLFLSTAAL